MESERQKNLRYLQVYRYYQNLMESGQLGEGDRLPSVRKCCEQLSVSRTTVETAYLMLAAEGYLLSKPQSGYYVTGFRKEAEKTPEKAKRPRTYRFDFSSSSADPAAFDFSAWRRYSKSALRKDERLLSYGDPQGEGDLREALSTHLAATRNIYCSPEQVVVGAGIQSLLQLLCPLIGGRSSVSFPSDTLRQPIAVFVDHGFDIRIGSREAGVLYLTPSRMNRLGEVMPYAERRSLAGLAAEGSHLMIEDDYESELVYPGKPLPSLFSLSGGRSCVYLGTFSRILLPSIRLSFMVLPVDLLPAYQSRKELYNQTASKADQIALSQWLRDGHFEAALRKLRRLYQGKTRLLADKLKEALPERTVDVHNLNVSVQVKDRHEAEAVERRAELGGVRFDAVVTLPGSRTAVLLSPLSLSTEQIAASGEVLRAVFADPES